MKVIIAGSRHLKDPNLIKIVTVAVFKSGFTITEVVSGKASGIDFLGEQWAKIHNIPIQLFPAKWKDIKAPGAVIKYGPGGAYNAIAGIWRNRKMVEYADALIAIPHPSLPSKGTADIIKYAISKKLPHYVFEWTESAKLLVSKKSIFGE